MQDTLTPNPIHPGLLRPPTLSLAPPKPSTATSNACAAPLQDFRNLTHYITQAFLKDGGLELQLHPYHDDPVFSASRPSDMK